MHLHSQVDDKITSALKQKLKILVDMSHSCLWGFAHGHKISQD